ncbi:MAG: SpoIIE family protein phosphatase [Bacteroidetes bacterium]|nr:SpoIIE family protein phosphatase [Bacteroidota bacterium]
MSCFLFSVAFSQSDLPEDIRTLKTDSEKVHALVGMSLGFSNNNFKQSMQYAQMAYDLAQKKKYMLGMDRAINAMADAYWYHSDYERAQEYYFKSYKLNDSIHDQRGIAYAMYNIGWIACVQKHNFSEDHYLYTSSRIYHQLNDTDGIIRIANALGSYHSEHFKATNQKPFFDSALHYFSEGLKLSELPNYRTKKGNFVSNMADLFAEAGDYNTAIFYNDQGTAIHIAMHDTATVMMNTNNKANYFSRLNRCKEALPLYHSVLDYCIKHDIKDLRASALKGLSECSYALGNYKDAYDYFTQFKIIEDTLDQQMYATSMQQMQSSYELGKAETDIKELKQISEIQELKNKQNGYFIFILIGVAVGVLVVAGLLFRQNKLKQQANVLLQAQKNEISEKKREIENSIQYAKGIQNAILPPLEELKQVFPDSFVFYQPKDVVSGDFYWFQKTDEHFYCIAADCTGHGVPGALMSIIGVDKIVQAIFEKKIFKPNDILSFLNREIKQVLKQHSDEAKQKDGMDIAVLRFNLKDHSVDFAGANRPLLIVRGGEMIEVKPDKIAIAGITPPDQEYKLTTVPLRSKDSIYIFSDGYADQFGGDNGKKFMTKNMKELFVSIASLGAKERGEKVKSTFYNWKEPYEQVDDVLVIGINLA